LLKLGGSPGSPSHQSLYWRGVEAFGWRIPPVQESKVRILVVELTFLEDSFGCVDCLLNFSVCSSTVCTGCDMLKVPFFRKHFEIQ